MKQHGKYTKLILLENYPHRSRKLDENRFCSYHALQFSGTEFEYYRIFWSENDLFHSQLPPAMLAVNFTGVCHGSSYGIHIHERKNPFCSFMKGGFCIYLGISVALFAHKNMGTLMRNSANVRISKKPLDDQITGRLTNKGINCRYFTMWQYNRHLYLYNV